ncbi:GAF domain-containing protein [Curtobacterium pusillum]|uniref:sensor histidine kinase n=1 Tax=Curtobacterium pusillum TaxID=69373 RepID=UPI00119EEAC5|nr:GAF domain-containing protein [Curtobacterium pusillum]
MAEPLAFPDAPRSALERTIDELVDRAQAVLRTQGRLRNLLAANRRIVEHLELEDTLYAVVSAAVELVDAEYGALGVIAPDGKELERFIHVGLDEEHVRRIGHLPHGKGVLGAVVQDAQPIRLEHLGADPRSAGFPEGHPPMEGFLGVPLRVRDKVYGNLYLTNPRRGHFTQEDQELVEALGATAGVAIDNARLFEESRIRERWATATADVSSALVTDESIEDVLTIIADRVLAFVDAHLVTVVLPDTDADYLQVAIAVGPVADRVRDRRYLVSGSLAGRAIDTGSVVADTTGAVVAGFDWTPALGPTIAIPLRVAGDALGALVVARAPGGPVFADAELGMADEFGRQTSVALAVARGRRDRRRLELAEDRSRIARDLHDHVIQRLFGSGLALQATAQRVPEDLRDHLEEQVSAIDAAIAEVRTAVFALGSSDRPVARSTRDRLLDVVTELRPALARPPRITFSGPVDIDVTGALARDVVAAVRESVANVARHAPGAECTVEVAVTDDAVQVVVEDDGPGPGASERRSGTANLAARATMRGGRYELGPGRDGGTTVVWTVPLQRTEERTTR